MKLDNVRKTWTKQLGQYIQEDAYSEVIELDFNEQMFEFLMMGLPQSTTALITT